MSTLDSQGVDTLEIYEMAMERKDILSPDSSFSKKLRSLNERYGPRELVGKGGTKKIYRVEDCLTGRFVAMAVLRNQDDPAEHDHFLREARLTAALEHPNIMPVYDLGFDDQKCPFFTMKYTGGQNLYQLLTKWHEERVTPLDQQKRDWPLFERLNLFAGICEGIAYAHSRNILHLDLKPRNILAGEFGEVLICDWGLGKVLFEKDLKEDTSPSRIDPVFFHEVTLQGDAKGTPGYMAPEQIDKTLGSRDQRTDVYALGGILHALLTGNAPIPGGTTQEMFKKTLAGQIAWSDLQHHHIPPALEAVLRKALACDPKNRYQTVMALKQDVLAFMGGFATSAENAGFFRNTILLTKRYKAASGLAGVLLLSSLVFTGYLYRSEQSAKKLLGLYTTAKKYHIQYREETVEELIELARKYQADHVYVKAITYATQVISQNPENHAVWAIIGECHFYLQEFNAATTALSRGLEASRGDLIQLAKKYGQMKPDQERLPADDLVGLLSSFDLDRKRLLFAKERIKYTDLEDHMKTVRYMLAATNPNQKDLHFEFQIVAGTIHLDISGNHELTDFYALKGLPLSVMNMENCSSVGHNMAIRHLKGMPLEELNTAGTNIRSFEFLDQYPDLTKLTVTKRFSKRKLHPLRQRMTVIEKELTPANKPPR